MKTSFSVALILLLSGLRRFSSRSRGQLRKTGLPYRQQRSRLCTFQKAAEADPNYVYGPALRQGVWSYVKPVNYDMGRLPQAREALERALSR